ncbi:MAG TPA: hypothetical protein PK037_06205 [Saprospiraceae bacterium]|nr:hypothetical protein [Saprospiraceae bacterium]
MKSFDALLGYFPEITLPVTLTDESVDIINASNDPLPVGLTTEFIQTWEGGEEADEFTEYMPCFRFKPHKDITAMVYWKASLMRYEFIMVTLNDKHEVISKKTICGTLVEGDLIKKSVARIDEEFIIHIAAGAHHADSEFSAQHSQPFAMEIMANGEIAFMAGDD